MKQASTVVVDSVMMPSDGKVERGLLDLSALVSQPECVNCFPLPQPPSRNSTFPLQKGWSVEPVAAANGMFSTFRAF